ncbi:alpha/beta hydrolase family protein [Bowmanella dokdonensis]|uniref:Alpha/beta hydrolase n=1 Tax=Bowmanella dokdonensis TaxID=751969 RepID=A0A939DMP9_9ALTE|nr:alpha/beta fold hydrolase [Bowmanella dokdonensis]MBN7825414.1 alpha/beta hydrolase [Bowmanella dokdonensis]
MIEPRQVQLKCEDGVVVQGTLFSPAQAAKASVLLLPGVGISQPLYRPFARYLAHRGYQVLTLDYRGIGQSFLADLKPSQASLSAWAKMDAVAGFHYLQSLDGQAPLIFAHSFGGQALCVADALGSARGVVMVASQSGYWRHWQGLGRLKLWFFWHLYLPFISRLGSYTPSTLLFKGRLPAGVASEWAKWGRHPHYLKGYQHSVTDQLLNTEVPIIAYAFSDDDFAPPDAAKALWQWFPQRCLQSHVLTPDELSVPRIGHFSAFNPSFENSLWRRWTDDFDSLLSQGLSTACSQRT